MTMRTDSISQMADNIAAIAASILLARPILGQEKTYLVFRVSISDYTIDHDTNTFYHVMIQPSLVDAGKDVWTFMISENDHFMTDKSLLDASNVSADRVFDDAKFGVLRDAIEQDLTMIANGYNEPSEPFLWNALPFCDIR